MRIAFWECEKEVDKIIRSYKKGDISCCEALGKSYGVLEKIAEKVEKDNRRYVRSKLEGLIWEKLYQENIILKVIEKAAFGNLTKKEDESVTGC